MIARSARRRVLRPRNVFAWLALTAITLTAHAAEPLVILSPHWEGIRHEFGTAFQEDYRRETGRDVDLKWLDVGGTSDILKYIRSEFKSKPGGIGVDILFGGGSEPFVELKKDGLMAAYRLPDEILRGLPRELNGVPLYDPEHTWYAAALAGFGILYNKPVLKRVGLPEPKTWEDLARPEFRTWVGSADPRKSGSIHVMYEIILQAYGWERGWRVLTAMGGNVRGFTASASQTAKDVALGEVACAPAIDSYAWAQVREAGEDVIGYVMPRDLTVVTGDAIGILKGAPNRPVAERFVTFVLSERGQKLWLLSKGAPGGPKKFELGKFSVRPGLYQSGSARSAVRLNPFAWKSKFTYDAGKGSARWDILNDLIGTRLIDAHGRLVRAWRKAVEDRATETEIHRLSDVPVTEAQAMELAASGRWRDPHFRTRAVREWAAAARSAYGSSPGDSALVRALPALAGILVLAAMVFYGRRRRIR